MGRGNSPLRKTAIGVEKYSFSKLSTFNQCKYQYYLNYIEKRKGKDNAFSQYGTFVHSILERHAKGELAAYELLDVYRDGYDKAVTEPFPPNKYVELAESYYQDGYEFLKNFDGLDDLEILGVETRFREPLDDFCYTGVIDLTYRDHDGGIVVQDWKSKSKFKNKMEQSQFARQPLSYGLHIIKKYKEPPKTLRFYMFRKQEIIDIPFTTQDYESALGWIKDTVKEIRECEEWSATPDSFFCSELCGFRDMCEFKGGGTERTSTAKKSKKPKKN
jgi:hypothetical protein